MATYQETRLSGRDIVQQENLIADLDQKIAYRRSKNPNDYALAQMERTRDEELRQLNEKRARMGEEQYNAAKAAAPKNYRTDIANANNYPQGAPKPNQVNSMYDGGKKGGYTGIKNAPNDPRTFALGGKRYATSVKTFSEQEINNRNFDRQQKRLAQQTPGTYRLSDGGYVVSSLGDGTFQTKKFGDVEVKNAIGRDTQGRALYATPVAQTNTGTINTVAPLQRKEKDPFESIKDLRRYDPTYSSAPGSKYIEARAERMDKRFLDFEMTKQQLRNSRVGRVGRKVTDFVVDKATPVGMMNWEPNREATKELRTGIKEVAYLTFTPTGALESGGNVAQLADTFTFQAQTRYMKSTGQLSPFQEQALAGAKQDSKKAVIKQFTTKEGLTNTALMVPFGVISVAPKSGAFTAQQTRGVYFDIGGNFRKIEAKGTSAATPPVRQRGVSTVTYTSDVKGFFNRLAGRQATTTVRKATSGRYTVTQEVNPVFGKSTKVTYVERNAFSKTATLTVKSGNKTTRQTIKPIPKEYVFADNVVKTKRSDIQQPRPNIIKQSVEKRKEYEYFGKFRGTVTDTVNAKSVARVGSTTKRAVFVDIFPHKGLPKAKPKLVGRGRSRGELELGEGFYAQNTIQHLPTQVENFASGGYRGATGYKQTRLGDVKATVTIERQVKGKLYVPTRRELLAEQWRDGIGRRGQRIIHDTPETITDVTTRARTPKTKLPSYKDSRITLPRFGQGGRFAGLAGYGLLPRQQYAPRMAQRPVSRTTPAVRNIVDVTVMPRQIRKTDTTVTPAPRTSTARTSITPPSLVTPPTGITTPRTPPTIAPPGLLPFSFAYPPSRGARDGGRGKRKFRYAPSITSVLFNIHGSSKQSGLSGFEIRPLGGKR